MKTVLKDPIARWFIVVAIVLFFGSRWMTMNYVDSAVKIRFQELSKQKGQFVLQRGPERIADLEKRLKQLEGGK